MNKWLLGAGAALLVLAAVLIAPAAGLAQEENPCHPVAGWLSEEMGLEDCQELMDLHAEGTGYGEIVQAWVLSQELPGCQGDWTGLLEAHQKGQGWGELIHAYWLADSLDDSGITGQDLLAVKESGLGWGQISHAFALASALGVPFDEAVGLLGDREAWETIRDELDLEPGPPPWAGGPKEDQGGPAQRFRFEEQPGRGFRRGPPPRARGHWRDR